METVPSVTDFSHRPGAAEALACVQRGRRVPVIFDTDIGGDIDDTWALVMALQCPELDVRLVATDSGDTLYRARLAAKMLEACGRGDIPVAIGPSTGKDSSHQTRWLGDYDLSDYPGDVYEDGVAGIIATIRESSEPVTVVAIGPVPNLAEALRRAPDIVENARFVGMHGAIRMGYDGSPTVVPEANVRCDPGALRAVLAATWECTLTPLDTCGLVRLMGDRYQRVAACNTPAIHMLMENYRMWHPPWLKGQAPDCRTTSSVLFDTVAVYLAFSEDLVQMEELCLRVTDDGLTVPDPAGPRIRCATSWLNRDAFLDLLVARLVDGR